MRVDWKKKKKMWIYVPRYVIFPVTHDNMAVEGSLSSGKADNEVSGEVEKHTLKEYFTLEGTY